MPITFPEAVARFNQRINNPIQGHWAWLLPPYVLIVHHGRRTGRRFSTPAFGFRSGGTLVVPLLYGRDSQWVRNLEAAGSGEVMRGGRRYELTAPRVTSTPPAGLGPLARRVSALAAHQLVADVGARLPGGPRALHALRPRSRRRGS
jgi:deazaflavin-dependent oxidoreductase (nitroreductase family)